MSPMRCFFGSPLLHTSGPADNSRTVGDGDNSEKYLEKMIFS
jgi:hypothetical protein